MTDEWSESRVEYLRGLSDDYGVPFDIVVAFADMLGPNEDYDGLVASLEDISEYEIAF